MSTHTHTFTNLTSGPRDFESVSIFPLQDFTMLRVKQEMTRRFLHMTCMGSQIPSVCHKRIAHVSENEDLFIYKQFSAQYMQRKKGGA